MKSGLYTTSEAPFRVATLFSVIVWCTMQVVAQRAPVCPNSSYPFLFTPTYTPKQLLMDGTRDYNVDMDCSWRFVNLAATSGVGACARPVVEINFTLFETEAFYDTVTLYDGPDLNSPVMGIWSGSDWFWSGPGYQRTTQGNLSMTFESDESFSGVDQGYRGFAATFGFMCADFAPDAPRNDVTKTNCPMQHAPLVFTGPPPAASSLTLASTQYRNNMDCGWLFKNLISTCPVGQYPAVRLNFTRFSLEPLSLFGVADYLVVHDGDTIDAEPLATYFGTGLVRDGNADGAPVYMESNSPNLYLEFHTDFSNSGQDGFLGWSLLYSFVCTSNACQNVQCRPWSQCHQAVNCTRPYGTCANVTVDDNTPCNDGNATTVFDVCTAGVCQGVPNPCLGVTCPALTQCFLPSTCDLASGVCSQTPRADQTGCNDNNATTVFDVCTAGVCRGILNPCAGVVCAAPDSCHVAGSCVPLFNGTYYCTRVRKPEFQSCTVPANPIRCRQTTGVCQSGVCITPLSTDGTPCTTDDPSLRNQVCVAGKCGTSACAEVYCTALDQCHVKGNCSQGFCSNPTKPDNVPGSCEDGNPATQGDYCKFGVCVRGYDACQFANCQRLDQCHEPGVCFQGVCSNPISDNGKACNDGRLDTINDQCFHGVCVGQAVCATVMCTPPTPCANPGQCIQGLCTSGVNRPNGLACDDSNRQTVNDTCVDGLCLGINLCASVTCPPTPATCHNRSVCDLGKCVPQPLVNGTFCDDGNPSTFNDVCRGGVCRGIAACRANSDCLKLEQCKDVGVCNLTTGFCSNPNAPDNIACNDGNPNTANDKCVAGVCRGTDICDGVVCTAQSQCHAVGICAAGVCSNPLKPDGSSCDDGDSTTVLDQCLSGQCRGTSRCAGVACEALDQCHTAGTCNNGSCSNPLMVEGYGCNDGNSSTVHDQCSAGVCRGTYACGTVVCTAADSCHARGVCIPPGFCTNPSLADGTPCENGLPNQINKKCQAGICVGTTVDMCVGMPACTQIDQCHVVGTCNSTTGLCSTPTKANGAGCNDNNPLTVQDACLNGVCVGKDPCTLPNPCPAPAACKLPSNCTNMQCTTPLDVEDGTACNDSNIQTINDQCSAGVCLGTDLCANIVCAAQSQCQLAGVCDRANCLRRYKAAGSVCNDPRGVFYVNGTCNGVNDTCTGKFQDPCAGVVCAALSSCHTVGTCTNGTCSNPVKPNASPCAHANPFLLNTVCQSGVCTGSYGGLCDAVTCAPVSQCHTAGFCNPSNNNTCTRPLKPNGTACDDGNANTIRDVCTNGTCKGVDGCAGVSCPAPDVCRLAGNCSLGLCSYPFAPVGRVCNDGDPDTVNDTCANGVCQGIVIDRCVGRFCQALSPCHLIGLCDSRTGNCTNPVRSNGATCVDPRLINSQCLNGVCIGTNPCIGVTCYAVDQCHNVGVCGTNPAGVCSTPNKPDGTFCNDNNPATLNDSCTNGVCLGINPCAGLACAAVDSCHTGGLCVLGVCLNPAKPEGSECSDGFTYTFPDRCVNGICVGTDPCVGMVCTAMDQCHLAGQCSMGECSHPPVPNMVACNDGKNSTTNDRCVSGTCVGDDICTGTSCEPAGPCYFAGVCSSVGGVPSCTRPVRPKGTPCNDSNPLTFNDVCDKGVCNGTVNPCLTTVCQPLDQCHVAGTCDAILGCSHPMAPDGRPCNDGLGGNSVCYQGFCFDPCRFVDCAVPPDLCHTSGTCARGDCVYGIAVEGTPCLTGMNNQVGKCAFGVCHDPCFNFTCPLPPDQCHQYVCSTGTGSAVCGLRVRVAAPCVMAAAPNVNAVCNAQGNCVQKDTCADVVCRARDSCHAPGTCSSHTHNCSVPNLADGTECMSFNPNVAGGRCANGVCTGANSCAGVTCVSTEPCREPGECMRGVCSTGPLKADGAGCDDNDDTTVRDVCMAGHCVGQDKCTFLTCRPVDACHVAGVCTNGVCSNPAKPNGTPCDDHNVLTSDDRCQNGLCTGTNACVGKTCVALSQCHLAGECTLGFCSQRLAPTTQTCTPGMGYVMLHPVCSTGGCVGTTDVCQSVVCTPPSQCWTAGECDQATGVCNSAMKPDHTPCDDGNGDTLNDECISGACAGTSDACSPEQCAVPVDQCHNTGVCLNGRCTTPQRTTGAPCDDGVILSIEDQCTEQGVCHGFNPCAGVVCYPLTQCYLVGVCIPGLGSCTENMKVDGTACNDGDDATVNDRCLQGICVGTDPCATKTCVAEGPCKEAGLCYLGSCSVGANKATGTPCDDGNALTLNDVCRSGLCSGTDPCANVHCFAADQCHTAGVCTLGVCTNPAKRAGSPCDDGLSGTANDHCTALGVCIGMELCAGVVCRAVDQCHLPGVCIAGNCTNPNKPQGTPCNDGNSNTVNDKCVFGECFGLEVCGAQSCPEADQCHYPGVCVSGQCASPVAKADGLGCDDGNPNTCGDQCVAGVCQSRACDKCYGVVCALPGLCQLAGVCNNVTGECAYANRPTNARCDDGNPCSYDDRCSAQGVCTGSADPCRGVVCTSSCLLLTDPNEPCVQLAPCTPGVCQAVAVADDSTCTDNPPNTYDPRCSSGQCLWQEPCSTNPCANGGVCHAGASRAADPYACECVGGWSGPTCTAAVAAESSSSSGTAAGVGVGVALFLIILAVIAFVVLRRRRRQHKPVPSDGPVTVQDPKQPVVFHPELDEMGTTSESVALTSLEGRTNKGHAGNGSSSTNGGGNGATVFHFDSGGGAGMASPSSSINADGAGSQNGNGHGNGAPRSPSTLNADSPEPAKR